MQNTKNIASIIIGLLVLLLIGLFAWHMTERNQAQEALENEKASLQAQQNQQQETLKQEWQERIRQSEASYAQKLDKETSHLLQVAGVPLGWAVQTALNSKNPGQVRSYFDDLINYPGVRNIELVNASGTVTVATDKGREGTALDSSYPQEVLQVDKPAVFQSANNQLILAVPIFGLSAKQGTVVLSYDRNASSQANSNSSQQAAAQGQTANPASAGSVNPSAPSATGAPVPQGANPGQN